MVKCRQKNTPLIVTTFALLSNSVDQKLRLNEKAPMRQKLKISNFKNISGDSCRRWTESKQSSQRSCRCYFSKSIRPPGNHSPFKCVKTRKYIFFVFSATVPPNLEQHIRWTQLDNHFPHAHQYYWAFHGQQKINNSHSIDLDTLWSV